MSDTTAAAPPAWIVNGIDFRNMFWVVAAIAVMVIAILAENEWLLRFVHVVTGVLLTGADILLGFLIGPVLRRLDFETRRNFTLRLLPKTLFVMSTLGVLAPTSGWYLAVQTGYLEIAFPEFGWVVAALVIATILGVQGLFILLPANVRAYLEMRKDKPDPARVGRIMRVYFLTTASQGVMQVCIVVIMVKFATGL